MMSVTVIQEQPEIIVQQQSEQVVLEQELNNITVKQETKQVLVQPIQPQIIVQGGSIVATILPFSITATSNGQTVFTLPYTYTTIICLFIMGTGQDALAGDFTVNSNVVTLGSSAPSMLIGDLLFGAGQL